MFGYEKNNRPFRFVGNSGEAFQSENGYPSRTLSHNGWYLDEMCFPDDTIVGVVFQLSAKKGAERYLAGCEYNDGDFGWIETDCAYDTASEAAYAADEHARVSAEKEQEFREEIRREEEEAHIE